jgi:hypothetical protein
VKNKLWSAATNAEVELPATRRDHRGQDVAILRVHEDASPGRSGKIVVDAGDGERLAYPGVVGCYLADEPRPLPWELLNKGA